MLCRAIAAVLLLSGFYADAQLYGSKRVLIQCVRLGGPCQQVIGYIDRDGRFHPAEGKMGAWQH